MLFHEVVHQHINASYQSLAVSTTELKRCEEEIVSLVELYPEYYDSVVSWDVVRGFMVLAISQAGKKALPQLKVGPMHSTPKIKALDALASLADIDTEFGAGRCVVICYNLHAALRELPVAQLWQIAFGDCLFNGVSEKPIVRRADESEDDYEDRRQDSKTELVPLRRVPIILGTAMDFSPAVLPTITNIEFGLPTLDEQTRLFNRTLQNILSDHPDFANPPQERQDAICRSLLGMTNKEAENAIYLCAVRHHSLSIDACMETLEDQKAAVLKKTAALTYIHRSKIAKMEDVGGFAVLKDWARSRKSCYSPQARAAGMDLPKGIVLIGCPGTGKSLVGKVMANMLDLPLLILDIGGLFGSLVGQTEQALREVIRTIEALSGCVVLLDEVDKVWSGINSSNGDNGVSKRMFGSFLTWLAEKTDPSFVIMTMNRTDGIPPELFRAGRVDAIFSTDLPTVAERRDILGIHLRTRGISAASIFPTDDDWATIIAKTEECVGSELEAIVKGARTVAFERRGTGVPSREELESEAGKIVKVADLDRENIKSIREFCASRTIPVSQPLVSSKRTNRRSLNASSN